jgi:hypothetical protein
MRFGDRKCRTTYDLRFTALTHGGIAACSSLYRPYIKRYCATAPRPPRRQDLQMPNPLPLD